MSSGTNSERITQNNTKLAELKTKVDNLPDYQDIEPIYTTTSYNMIPVESLGTSYDSIFNVLTYEDYLICSWVTTSTSSPAISTLHLYKLQDNIYKHIKDLDIYGGEVKYSGGTQHGHCAIIDVDDDFIYLVSGKAGWSGVNAYKINLSTYDVTKLADKTVYNRVYYDIIWGGNGYALSANNSYEGRLLKLDDTKDAISDVGLSVIQYVYNVFNKFIPIFGTGGGYIFTITFTNSIPNIISKLIDTTVYGIIRGVNFLGNKIFTSTGVYVLSSDLTIGEKLSDSITPIALGVINDKYYISSRELTSSNNYKVDLDLYTFDEDTNSFSFVETYTNTRNKGTIQNESYLFNRFAVANFDYGTKQIGYNVYGEPLYFESFIGATTDKILSGYQTKDENAEIITGTMPNNGQLNYTPSTSQQTIPAGYTSGGTISAVTSAIDNNIQAENIKKGITILGITGTYEGDTSL